MRWVQWLAGGGLVVAAAFLVWGAVELAQQGFDAVPLLRLGTVLAIVFGIALMAGRRRSFWPALVSGGVAAIIGFLAILSVGVFILPFGIGVMAAAAAGHDRSNR